MKLAVANYRRLAGANARAALANRVEGDAIARRNRGVQPDGSNSVRRSGCAATEGLLLSMITADFLLLQCLECASSAGVNGDRRVGLLRRPVKPSRKPEAPDGQL